MGKVLFAVSPSCTDISKNYLPGALFFLRHIFCAKAKVSKYYNRQQRVRGGKGGRGCSFGREFLQISVQFKLRNMAA